jgi:hypothetical protein
MEVPFTECEARSRVVLVVVTYVRLKAPGAMSRGHPRLKIFSLFQETQLSMHIPVRLALPSPFHPRLHYRENSYTMRCELYDSTRSPTICRRNQPTMMKSAATQRRSITLMSQRSLEKISRDKIARSDATILNRSTESGSLSIRFRCTKSVHMNK